MTADPDVRLRADARRNRDQILAAAKAMFAEEGPDVPMEEIARRAGVGVGTLYRRFPDRDALIKAVAQDNFAQVLAEAEAAEGEEPTAWEALVRLLSRSRALRLSVHLALLSPQAWATIREDPQTQHFRDEIMDVLDRIVAGAQREGQLRSDVGAGDVAVLVSLLLKRVPAPKDTADVVTDRVLALMLDGLRARPGSPLPGRVLTAADLRDR
ncbi:TetR/AcrR family transcriptional regulator [Amycolatopsis acidiphila]|uniref:TetR/AcrR family transcriptional regulator n=1 Tax=Amycolatopsis acidiphila TaxID=715473 RepID=A0A557ZQN5_9PSEU|nr:TetR/AcrR family transcriptional regulator [Amycolatopsis acidiphila]TVT14291.1 TetR/AcrR family transcriptional regulator [Amycolatopsis acidiphila]UIJ60841.1 TetR/AcrR family transcriptional regulator [Amycolatopsis acidiphila]GHG94264.1 TetR family transcriptional regulator [Amycolatopsis acidiphila]